MAALPLGVHVDVTVHNAVVESNSSDGTAALIRLEGATDGNGLIEVWVPTVDPRITITQSVPANWPPQANDVWQVPNISQPAFVVDNGAGTLYFCQGSDIITLANSKGEQIPMTTDQALAQFGTQLVLKYRNTP